jgi:tetratricopeptide (TPR) repeat protein
MNYSENNNHFQNKLISVNEKITGLFVGIIREYFNQVSSKYKLPELDNLLDYILKTIESEISEEGGFDVHLIYEDETEDKEQLKIEMISEEDFTKQFSGQFISEEDLMPVHLKEKLTLVDYLLVKSFYFGLHDDNLPIALLNFQTVLTIKPNDPVAYTFYHLIEAQEELEEERFYRAMANSPGKIDPSFISYRSLVNIITNLYSVIVPGEYIKKSTFTNFLIFFTHNEVRLFDLLRDLYFRYSPENMLELLNSAMKKNPGELELKMLHVWILFKLKRYGKAFSIAQNLDNIELTVNSEDNLTHRWIYAELMNIHGQTGKAFIELKSIVEEEEGSLNDDYFEACLSLIKMYHYQENFRKSKEIFDTILKSNEEFMIETNAHKYYSLMGEMYLGLDYWDKALICFQKARDCKE